MYRNKYNAVQAPLSRRVNGSRSSQLGAIVEASDGEDDVLLGGGSSDESAGGRTLVAVCGPLPLITSASDVALDRGFDFHHEVFGW